jgi:hypothetical protein
MWYFSPSFLSGEQTTQYLEVLQAPTSFTDLLEEIDLFDLWIEVERKLCFLSALPLFSVSVLTTSYPWYLGYAIFFLARLIEVSYLTFFPEDNDSYLF